MEQRNHHDQKLSCSPQASRGRGSRPIRSEPLNDGHFSSQAVQLGCARWRWRGNQKGLFPFTSGIGGRERFGFDPRRAQLDNGARSNPGNSQSLNGRLIVAAQPKRVQAKQGRQTLSKKGRGPGRRRKAEAGEAQVREPREPNGHHEEMPRLEELGEPGAKADRFTRAAGEQMRQATDQNSWSGIAPQVLGWATTGPAEQFDAMLRQLWSGNGEPSRYARALAQANVEMIGLIGRRSRAYLDLPAHLARCRTPQQLMDEQAKFFQDMLHDYQVTNDRMMNYWMEAAAPSR